MRHELLNGREKENANSSDSEKWVQAQIAIAEKPHRLLISSLEKVFKDIE